MAETVMGFEFAEPVDEPEAGLRINQDCVFEAVQLSVPPPEFRMERVPLGFDPPAAALRDIDEASIPIVGGVFGFRIRVAGITAVEITVGSVPAEAAKVI